MEALFIIGRIIFGLYFIYSGYGHFRHFKNTAGYAGSKGVPFAKGAVALTGALMIVGGLSFVFAYGMQVGSLLLLIFLVPTTFIMHRFWSTTDPDQKMGETINFTKNLALIGALLMLMPLFAVMAAIV